MIELYKTPKNVDISKLEKDDVIKSFGEVIIFKRLKNSKKTYTIIDTKNKTRDIKVNLFDKHRKFTVIGKYIE